MIFLKAILCLIFFIIIPEIIGQIFYFKHKEIDNVVFALILGYMIQFAILEVTAVPMTFLKCKFTTLFIWYVIISAILIVISIFLSIKNKRKFVKPNFSNFKENIVLKIFTIFIIGVQVFCVSYFTHIDDDDSVYVAASTTALQTNTIYEINPKDGTIYSGIYPRYALFPIFVFQAIASKITLVHPTIIWHTILPPILMLMAYSVYYMLAKKWLNNFEERCTFLISLSFVNLFGWYRINTIFSFFLLNIWQGKSILANIIIPFIWYIFLENILVSDEFKNWLLIFISVIAGCFVSGMAVVLIPISLISISLLFSIKDKKIDYLMKSLLCIVPCIILGIIYIVYS